MASAKHTEDIVYGQQECCFADKANKPADYFAALKRLRPKEEIGEQGIDDRENDKGRVEDARRECRQLSVVNPVGVIDVRMFDPVDDAPQGRFRPYLFPVDILDGGKVKAYRIVIGR